MDKWYEVNVNNSSILSGRIRLARNFDGKLFPTRANNEERIAIINETASALSHYKGEDELKIIRIDAIDNNSRQALVDRHLISPNLAKGSMSSCVFVGNSEKHSIMAMEEDHVRIQAIEAGDAIDSAYANACAVDDVIDEYCDYAFDDTTGYLTSCPTNAGTGMRASFMLHIPYLEANGQIGNIARSISKFGFTLRGTFGENSEAHGAVYQISNQVTLGLTEEEIITNIKNLAYEIAQKEQALMEKDLGRNRLLVEDKVFRTYGILTNARQMAEKEAISNLSVLKIGAMAGIIDKPFPNIYNLIINIRGAMLAKNYGIANANDTPLFRAQYLREKLG